MSIVLRDSLKIYSGNLHIIPNHYIAFNSERTNMPDKKKTTQLFFHGEPIYIKIFEILACTVSKILHAEKKHNERT